MKIKRMPSVSFKMLNYCPRATKTLPLYRLLCLYLIRLPSHTCCRRRFIYFFLPATVFTLPLRVRALVFVR